jgi:hypothetical protein
LKNDPDIWLEDLRQSHEAYNEADPWVKTWTQKSPERKAGVVSTCDSFGYTEMFKIKTLIIISFMEVDNPEFLAHTAISSSLNCCFEFYHCSVCKNDLLWDLYWQFLIVQNIRFHWFYICRNTYFFLYCDKLSYYRWTFFF